MVYIFSKSLTVGREPLLEHEIAFVGRYKMGVVANVCFVNTSEMSWVSQARSTRRPARALELPPAFRSGPAM